LLSSWKRQKREMRILTTTVVTLLASAALVAPGGQPRRRAALLLVSPRGSSGWEGRLEWVCSGSGRRD
jgi:hypothetical protein